MTALVQASHVSKTFAGVTVLSDVSFEVASGEVLAVVGHNGSGKSTLVKVLAGIHSPDPGSEIRIHNNEEMHFIHQDLGLVNSLSAVENLGLSDRTGWRGVAPLAGRAERKRARETLARFGASFDVSVPLAKVSAAERSIVAIARALEGWEEPERVLVLDEPTAALHGDEVQILFNAVRHLAARGAGIIFISHRLDEVMNLAHRVLALRDGHVVANVAQREFDHDHLVRLVAGRDVPNSAKKHEVSRGRPVLRARGVCGPGLAPMDLDLHAGEIVGVSGNVGSGRDRIASILFGASEMEDGEVWIDGQSGGAPKPRSAIRAGLGYVPADRAAAGGVMTLNSRENLILPSFKSIQGRFRRLDRRAERQEVQAWLEDLEVHPQETERELRLFSGGNQQKVILAKWLRLKPKVLLLDEPTAGVDVGAKESIYELIIRAAREGTAVLVCSSEAKELTMLCDRVLVLRDGILAAEVPRVNLTEARLVRESLGVSDSDAEEAEQFV